MPDSAVIRVEYEQNFDTWYQALLAAQMIPVRPYLAAMAYAGGCAALALIAWRSHDQLLGSILVALALVFLWSVTQAKAFQRRYLLKNWNRSRTPNLPLRICLSESGIMIDSEIMHTELKWAGVLRSLETVDLLILITATGNVLALPKRRIDANAMNHLRALIARQSAPATGSPLGFAVIHKERT